MSKNKTVAPVNTVEVKSGKGLSGFALLAGIAIVAGKFLKWY